MNFLETIPTQTVAVALDFPTLKHYLPAYFDGLGKNAKIVKTYLSSIDNEIEGLRGLTIVGGSPGSGKTSLCLQIAFDNCENTQTPVVIYSLEMPREEILTRILQRISPAPYKTFQQPWNAANPAPKLQTARFRLEAASERLFIFDIRDSFALDDNQRPTVLPFDFAQLETRLNLLKAHFQTPPLVVIDSIHELPTERFSDLKQRMDFIMLNLRKVADNTGAHFILVSHQNRQSQQNSNQGLNSFLGSAGIEYTVDLAITVLETDSERQRLIKVVKNRYGKRPEVTLSFNGEICEFTA